MNPKICFYTPPYPGVTSYTEMIDLAVAHGLTAVEGFCYFELAEPDVDAARRIRRYADEKGVVFPCFSVFCDVAGEDGEAQVARLCQFAQVAAILGAPYLHHTIACDFSHPQAVLANREILFRQGVARVRAVYDYAQSVGVRTIYEDQGFIFNGVAGIGRFLESVDRNVGLVADFGNIAQVGEAITDLIAAFSKQIVHVHVKDLAPVAADCITAGCIESIHGDWVQEVEIGCGQVPVEKAIRLLQTAGYDGYYSVEYQGQYPGDPSVRRVLDRLSQLVG